MTSHITMNELVELATLDAFGLLPAADSVKFEQAFMTAPADVQAEIDAWTEEDATRHLNYRPFRPEGS